jgi:flagellar hook-associated protein 1 FlgK
MAVMGTSFQIGRSALAAYQAAIAVTGQNIANVGNPEYARQSARLAAQYGGLTICGIAPGTGVELSELRRHVDSAIESRLRMALGSRSGAETLYRALSRIESLYGELSDQDLSTQMSELFGAFANLETDPTDSATRSLVLSQADLVVATLQRHRTGLLGQVSDLNDSVGAMVTSANGLAAEIARLNELIVTTEARAPGGAGALRDRRDGLLRELGEMMDIQTREQDNGIVNVYVGSEPLVEAGRSRGLTTETVLEDGLERVTVRFADNNGTVRLRDGQLGAAVAARDVHLAEQLENIDALAAALIYETNRVHSSGQGLVGYTSITGTYAADAADAALNTPAAGLAFPVENGSFYVRVRDTQSGQVVTRMITVDLDGLNGNDTTLTTLAGALNAIPGMSATLTGDNRLQLDAQDGYEITFADDTSGALAALGVGTFFEGTNATTMDINPALRANPQLLAASSSGDAGDGSNAGRLAGLGRTASSLLGQLSILEYHESMTTSLGVATGAAATGYEAADAVYSSLLAQREATSGVSLDEEVVNLTKYERSFQGASRFLSVLDSLSAEILDLAS